MSKTTIIRSQEDQTGLDLCGKAWDRSLSKSAKGGENRKKQKDLGQDFPSESKTQFVLGPVKRPSDPVGGTHFWVGEVRMNGKAKKIKGGLQMSE